MKSNDAQTVSASVPRHIGIIMDGNGRWATARHLPRAAGHRAGVNNITPIVEFLLERGVRCVTLYAFSTENQNRPQSEIKALFSLFRKHLKPLVKKLISRGARATYSGDRSYFPEDILALMAETESWNDDPDAQVVNIALNYGARAEIVRACKLAAENGEITEEGIARGLYTAGLPELDMIVRTGGEKRLSNFLLYQAAYSELFFSDTLWPDFSVDELGSLLDEFSTRTRRFGKV